MTVFDTPIPAAEVAALIETYRAFFHLPAAEKAKIDMAVTGSNRGWGGPGSEQVDPNANPDYKQVFDCGFELPADDPYAGMKYYAPNRWPDTPPYGGIYEEIVPHLTVAHDLNETDGAGVVEIVRHGQMRDDFNETDGAGVVTALEACLPVACSATEVLLMTGREGVWTLQERFPFSPGGP